MCSSTVSPTATEFSRKSTAGPRPAVRSLKACLDYVREGDVLVVTRLDRLARSTLHLCQIAEELKKKGVDLQVLDQSINTGDATGRLLFNMLGAINQFETEIRAERQMDGIRKAKEQGVAFGRQKSLSDQEVQELREKTKRRGADQGPDEGVRPVQGDRLPISTSRSGLNQNFITSVSEVLPCRDFSPKPPFLCTKAGGGARLGYITTNQTVTGRSGALTGACRRCRPWRANAKAGSPWEG